MLRHLSIHNYALIDHLDIELDDGLTILTGETGAGKSVMMGAISLLMGRGLIRKSLPTARVKPWWRVSSKTCLTA